MIHKNCYRTARPRPEFHTCTYHIRGCCDTYDHGFYSAAQTRPRLVNTAHNRVAADLLFDRSDVTVLTVDGNAV